LCFLYVADRLNILCGCDGSNLSYNAAKIGVTLNYSRLRKFMFIVDEGYDFVPRGSGRASLVASSDSFSAGRTVEQRCGQTD